MITHDPHVSPRAAAVVRPHARRLRYVAVVGVLAVLTACSDAVPSDSASSGSQRSASKVSASAPADAAKAAAIRAVVHSVMASEHLRSAIVRVTVGGRNVLTQAWGQSMKGVPATTDMHFRNGAVAISYMSTLLLELVDQHKVSLEDKVSRWLPDVPHSDEVTLGQLAQMTAGYVDYVTQPPLDRVLYKDPFADISEQTRLKWSTRYDLLYPPGTNWNYSHTDYIILGMALARITGQPLAQAIKQNVLEPLGLHNTDDPGTPAIPDPVLHAYSSERRYRLGIPPGKAFTEDSTFWNPSWTLAKGAIEYTDIHDLNATAVAIGTGALLSRSSYDLMTTKDLIGRTTALKGCKTCFPQSAGYTYGLGVVSSGNWLLQNPLFAGEAGSYAYLPSQHVAIAVEATFKPAAFTSPKSPRNAADLMWRKIGAVLVPPADAPPIHP